MEVYIGAQERFECLKIDVCPGIAPNLKIRSHRLTYGVGKSYPTPSEGAGREPWQAAEAMSAILRREITESMLHGDWTAPSKNHRFPAALVSAFCD